MNYWIFASQNKLVRRAWAVGLSPFLPLICFWVWWHLIVLLNNLIVLRGYFLTGIYEKLASRSQAFFFLLKVSIFKYLSKIHALDALIPAAWEQKASMTVFLFGDSQKLGDKHKKVEKDSRKSCKASKSEIMILEAPLLCAICFKWFMNGLSTRRLKPRLYESAVYMLICLGI